MSDQMSVKDYKEVHGRMEDVIQSLLYAIEKRRGNVRQHVKPLWVKEPGNEPSNLIEAFADFCVGTHKIVPKDDEEIVFCLLRPHSERLEAVDRINDDATLMRIGTSGAGSDDIHKRALSRVKDERLIFDLIESFGARPFYFVYSDQLRRLTDIERLTKLAIQGQTHAVQLKSIEALIILKNDKALRKVAAEHRDWQMGVKALRGITNIVEVMQVARDSRALPNVKSAAAEMERTVKRQAELREKGL